MIFMCNMSHIGGKVVYDRRENSDVLCQSAKFFRDKSPISPTTFPSAASKTDSNRGAIVKFTCGGC